MTSMYQKLSGASRDLTSTTDVTLRASSAQIRTRSIELIAAVIPMTVYNITSSNNIVSFNDGANRTATITPGLYNPTTLAAALGSLMTTASGAHTYTATYSATTMRMTVTDGTGNFYFRWGSVVTNSAAAALGFNAADGSAAASAVGDFAPALGGDGVVYLNVDGVRQGLGAGVSSWVPFEWSFFIPVDVSLGSTLVYQPADVGRQRIVLAGPDSAPIAIDQLRVRVLNSDGTLLANNGGRCEFIFGFC